MTTLLALTVGGSCAPVVTAIRDYAPDFVCFFASGSSRVTVDGPGDPCGYARRVTCPECGKTHLVGNPMGVSIIAQTGLTAERYRIVEFQDPDAFGQCYVQVYGAFREIAGQHQDGRRIADYTGGTKTMTAAMTAAALELGWELSLVKGARTDLVKVRNGTEVSGLVNAAEVRARRGMAEAQRLFNSYAYTSAGEVLKAYLQAAPLPPDLQREIRERIALCRAFDAWDRFDHAKARVLMEPYRARCVPQWIFLTRLTGQPYSYASILDLLRNAERRAARGRYDDAVARLYRALELLAQIRLSQRDPSLSSHDLDVKLLPEALHCDYEALRDDNGVIKIGLRQDYELLAALGDPLGEVYVPYRNRLLNALHYRNDSILAHGLTPISFPQWREMEQEVGRFIKEGLEALKFQLEASQFPQWGLR